MNLNCALELVEFVEAIYGFNKNKIGKWKTKEKKKMKHFSKSILKKKKLNSCSRQKLLLKCSTKEILISQK